MPGDNKVKKTLCMARNRLDSWRNRKICRNNNRNGSPNQKIPEVYR